MEDAVKEHHFVPLEGCCLSGCIPSEVRLLITAEPIAKAEVESLFPHAEYTVRLQGYYESDRESAWKTICEEIDKAGAKGATCLWVTRPTTQDFRIYALMRGAKSPHEGLRYEAFPLESVPAYGFFGPQYESDVRRLAGVKGTLPSSAAAVLWFLDEESPPDLPSNVHVVCGAWGAWRAKHPMVALPSVFCPDFPSDLRNDIVGTAAREQAEISGIVTETEQFYPQPATGVTSVLFPSSIHTTVLKHVYADCAAAVRDSGGQAYVLQEGSEEQLVAGIDIARAVRSHIPKCVVFIDHLRHESGAFPKALPVATWIQDDLPHLRNPELIKRLTEHDYVFAYSSEACKRYEKLGYHKVCPLPMGVNPKRFPFEPGPGDGRIAIIANLQAQGATPPMREWLEYNTPEESHLLSLEVPQLTLRMMAAIKLRVPYHERPAIEYHVWQYIRQMNLLCTLSVVKEAGAGIALYGAGWGGTAWAEHCRGPVGPAELPEVYRKHTAVLTPANNLLLHARVLETFAAGGCSIQRGNNSLEGLSVDQYYTLEGLQKMCLKVISSSGYRRELIEEGYQEVLNQHTYAHRMRTLLATVLGNDR